MSQITQFDQLQLEQLDALVKQYAKLVQTPRPSRGWVRALREGLGMTEAQLGKRAGIARATVATLERSEARNTITLDSLEKLARGLGCRVVYAVVPAAGETLSDLRRARAAALAREQLSSVAHTMRLEAQGLEPRSEARQAARLTGQLLAGSPRKLWQ